MVLLHQFMQHVPTRKRFISGKPSFEEKQCYFVYKLEWFTWNRIRWRIEFIPDMRGKHYTLESYFNYQRRTMNCVISFRFIKRRKCAIFFTDCAVTGSALYGQFYCFCTHTCHMRVAFCSAWLMSRHALVPVLISRYLLTERFFCDSRLFALTFWISLLPVVLSRFKSSSRSAK